MLFNVLLQTIDVESKNVDFLDALIVVLILLFILSTITEKLTELTRMYPIQFRIIGILACIIFAVQIIFGIWSEPPIGVIKAFILLLADIIIFLILVANSNPVINSQINSFKALSSKLSVFNNIKKEKIDVNDVKKEREVTALSFMIGLIVSILFNANLFNFFDSTHKPGLMPYSSPFLPIKDSAFYSINPAFFELDLVTIIGFILTAFFLAFGAKFFHDLLDNLLQIKNLRRKINEKENWDFNNITEFDNYFSSQEKSRFEEYISSKFNKPGVFPESDFENKRIVVYVSDPSISFPQIVFYKTSLGKIWEIQVERVESPGIGTLSLPLFPSSEIANQTPYASLRGTLGHFVKSINSTNIFLLTCYHVVWNQHDWDHFRPIEREIVVHPSNGQEIGTIYAALKNASVDAVLINPGDIEMLGEILDVGLVQYDRPLNSGDIGLRVRMRGNTLGYMEGYIAGLNKYANILYPDRKYRTLNNLILVKTKDGTPFSAEGDSGSFIVDDFGYAVGMLVAGDQKSLSFAIPFSILREQLNIEILNTKPS